MPAHHFVRNFLVILLGFGMVLASNFYDISLETSFAQDKQPGRMEIMIDQANPNIGKKFPEVTAESLEKPANPFRIRQRGR